MSVKSSRDHRLRSMTYRQRLRSNFNRLIHSPPTPSSPPAQYSPLRTYQELFARAVERENVYPFGRISHETVMQRFRTGKEAVVISSPGIPYRQNGGAGANAPCPFFVESSPVMAGFSHFILQRDSFFLELFNKKLMWLRDTGVLKKVTEDHNAIHCAAHGSVDGSSRPLTLVDIQGAFLILLAGVALAALSFALELAVARRGKPRGWAALNYSGDDSRPRQQYTTYGC
ncbi:uncharacterized protein LOC122251148 [Penaeus japonicus]|uniref:uncharacterized protein LOC122251148 n=1 Tax=Penaeus japonicus TaxID=27405 RepID=UPI001C7178A6|nr:uncharacterized protein LOC122251148 [Penaeus japonicus]